MVKPKPRRTAQLTDLISAQPFNPDFPYRLSEQGYDKLCLVKHTLALIMDLAGSTDGTVTLSRESLAVVTAHLGDILKTI